jgi:hypothetical protein
MRLEYCQHFLSGVCMDSMFVVLLSFFDVFDDFAKIAM